jgi:AAA domain
VAGIMTDPAFDAWFAQARAVPLDQIIQQRNIKLKRQGVELIGPCPKCGGEDRFGVNLREQLYNCRKCGAKGHGAIDFTRWLDGIEPIPAAEYLNGEPPPKANGKNHTPEPRAARFLYPDENGETLFGVSRVEFQNPDGSFVLKDGKRKKTFSQWRPDPNNTGKWLPGVEGVRVIPYRLPELIEAIGNGRSVLIVEGESKVDLLRSWNLPATCCAGGAGKWKPEHSEFFRGAEVIILPDNDEPGRKHRDIVGASLQGIATKVCVLELPDLGSKGDILDWARAGGTREKLDELLRQARPWAPPEEAKETKAEEQRQEDHPQQVNGDDDDVPDLGERDAGDDVDLPPPRRWLLGNQFCRTFLSGLVAPGSTGKSALRLAQCLSLATGRALTGQHVFKRGRVLLISFEDDQKEIQRRILAARLHHNVTLDDVKGWLFYATPKGIKLAEIKNGSRQIGRLEKSLRKSIERRRPDLLVLDPYVKLHALEENDNGAMDFVCDLLVTLAIEYDIAVDAPHHTKKGHLTPGDADSGRGASATRDAGRLIYTLATMNEEESNASGISPEERASYIRLDKGKVNLAPPARTAVWFKLVGVQLGNGDDEYPNGDEVQTVVPWEPPKLWDGLASATLNAVLTDIDNAMPNGQRYSAAGPARDRAAWRVVQKHCPDRTETQGREIINTWVKNGVLYDDDYDDPVDRKPRKGLRLDPTKRPS